MIRLYVEAPLAAGTTIEATEGQAHYLGGVMRRAVGDAVRLFNGSDGEWAGRIASLSRGKATLAAETLVRPQSADADLWLMFAVLKRDTTDLVVQKATELGVSALLPVFTERTNAGRVNLDRLRAIAIEAAEQSERLTVPVLRPVRQLHDILAEWPADRALFVALERADAQPPTPWSGPAGAADRPRGRVWTARPYGARPVPVRPSGFARAAHPACRNGGDRRSGLVASARLGLSTAGANSQARSRSGFRPASVPYRPTGGINRNALGIQCPIPETPTTRR